MDSGFFAFGHTYDPDDSKAESEHVVGWNAQNSSFI